MPPLNRLLKWLPVLIALCCIAVAGLQMNRLPLWGWWPLMLFVGIWLCLTWWRVLRLWHDKSRVMGLAYATLSGLMLAAGFPMMPTTFFLFVGFVPLLMVGRDMALQQQAGKRFFWLAWYSMVVFNLLTTWWVSNAALAASVVAIVLNSLFMAVPLWVFFITYKKTAALWLALTVWVSGWLSFEFLHHRWELTWPWLTLGNGLAMQPAWIQWYAYTGVAGGSLWILLVNAMVLYSSVKRHRSKWYRLWPSMLAFVMPVATGLLIYYNYTPQGEPQEVVVVQPNYEPHYEKFRVPESIQTGRTIELALTQLSPTTDWLVLPETVLRRGMNEDALSQVEGVQQYRSLCNRYPRLQIVGGADSYRIFDTKPAGHDAVHTDVRPDGRIRYWEAYNAAFHIDSSAAVSMYHKSKLVPGPERMPMRRLFFFLVPIVEHLGGTLEGVGTQKNRTAFGRDHFKAAPMICYESIFGDFARGYVHQGAQALFVMSNDGWWDNTPGHLQHRQFAVLRAIEARLDVVRSTNSGSSCFINQRGDIRNATQYNIPVAIKDTVLFRSTPYTFFVKTGDWVSWMGLVVLAGTLLYMFFFIGKNIKSK